MASKFCVAMAKVCAARGCCFRSAEHPNTNQILPPVLFQLCRHRRIATNNALVARLGSVCAWLVALDGGQVSMYIYVGIELQVFG
jgi:hypothetical protein